MLTDLRAMSRVIQPMGLQPGILLPFLFSKAWPVKDWLFFLSSCKSKIKKKFVLPVPAYNNVQPVTGY